MKSVTPSPVLHDPPRPARIGPYRPHGVLGTGGMATVYLASGGAQLGNRRWCALKVLHDQLNERENYRSMFFNEARIASEISHPHVCGVFDYGCIKGHAYLAMDYLRGKSLAAVSRACSEIADPKLHALRVARILADACEGLSAIHEHRSTAEDALRVVHRDVSPDNLILGFDGFVKVIDFGLAKIGGRGEKTESGILKGKVSYLAPELLQGDVPSPSADIWSLGVVAWELFTGKRLFRKATDAETLRALGEQEIEAPSKVLAGLPPNLDSVVLRALERDPRERYQSMAEFGAALWDFLRTRAELVQHRDLGTWLNQLFPGEEARLRARLESLPQSSPLAAPPAARRSVILLQHLRTRALRVMPKRTQSRFFVAAFAAAVCFGWGALKWSNTRAHVFGPSTASFLPAALAQGERSNFEQSNLPERLDSNAGFTVDVERANSGSELILHVRPAQGETRSGAR
jgi:serine/threonine protein kinase